MGPPGICVFAHPLALFFLLREYWFHLKNKTMIKLAKTLSIGMLLFFSLCLPGCAVAGGIFKAGVWVGVIAVVVVVGLIMYFVSRGSGKK
jgi:hypothetical protein